jgi:hypothetical protein
VAIRHSDYSPRKDLIAGIVNTPSGSSKPSTPGEVEAEMEAQFANMRVRKSGGVASEHSLPLPSLP